MNEQELKIFTDGVAHVRKQGVPAIGTGVLGTVCSYRGDNGTSCLIGGLIKR